MNEIKLTTIGFTKKSAARFFSLLRQSSSKRIVDVRLNNISQLAGFAKRDDLKFFVSELCEMEYVHIPELAPTQDMLEAYQKKRISWDEYQRAFLELMKSREIEKRIEKETIDGGCLLCSEDSPHHCHRRLVAEYLQGRWSEPVVIGHLL